MCVLMQAAAADMQAEQSGMEPAVCLSPQVQPQRAAGKHPAAVKLARAAADPIQRGSKSAQDKTPASPAQAPECPADEAADAQQQM